MKQGLTKKLLCSVLAIGMLLSGCASQNSGGAPASTASQAQAGSSAASTGEAPANTPEKATLTYMVQEHANWPISNDTIVLQEIEKQTGVKIEYVPVPNADYQEKVNIVMASGEYTDLMVLRMEEIKEYASRGVFIDIAPYLPDYADLNAMFTNEVKLKVMTDDDQIFGVPRLNQPRKMTAWLIREDWLKKAGLNAPTTTDEWLDALRAFKVGDFDGNGKNDTIPWVSYNTVRFLVMNVAPTFGLQFDNNYGFTEIDGKMVFNPTTERYKEMIEWLHTAYSEGLLDKEFAGIAQKQWEERMSNETGGATNSFIVRTDVFNNVGRALNPDYNLVAIEPITGPHGDKGVPTYSPILTDFSVGITKACKNPEAAMRYLNYMYSDEGMELTTWGVEGVTYTVENGKKVWSAEIAAEPGNYSFQAPHGIMQQLLPRRMSDDEERLLLVEGGNAAPGLAANQPFFKDPPLSLTYTKEENEKLNEITANLFPIVDQYSSQFIAGEISLADWNGFISQMESLGLEEYTTIYNNAYQRYIEKAKKLS